MQKGERASLGKGGEGRGEGRGAKASTSSPSAKCASVTGGQVGGNVREEKKQKFWGSGEGTGKQAR